MKKPVTILVLILIVFACNSGQKAESTEITQYYIESTLSFFDPYEASSDGEKYQGHLFENWLRQAENLRMLHETFKKIGYQNLVSKEELTSSPCLLWSYINRPLDQIIDSLVITYKMDAIETKYYREFWHRRKKENNDEIVYEILKEVGKELIQKQSVDYNKQLVNDTLYKLIVIDRINVSVTENEALKNFEYLKSIGLNLSAYNLLYERSAYGDINWDREKLVKQLRKGTKKCCPQAWVEDDIK